MRLLPTQVAQFVLFSLVFVSQGWAEPEPKKVVILVSSTGNGHISQAEALAEKVKRESPKSEVVIKVMEDFIPNQGAMKRDQWLFLQMMEKTPNLIERLAADHLNVGNQAPNYSSMMPVFDYEQMKSYLEGQKPDVILSAYYNGARAMGVLRERGHFRDVPNGYIVTELTEGYTPRIARRLDRVFLPDPTFGTIFEERGVPPSKISVTGLPVNYRLLEPGDRAKFHRENGLDLKGKTILVVSGGDGKGNLPGIAKELASKVQAPVNIVVVAGRNEKAKAQLDALQATLPEGVKLLATGLVPNEFVVDALRASDLFVGKAGGMMAAEVITAGKPAIFIKMLGGHEAEIWKRLGKVGYAEINNDVSLIGEQAHKLLSDEKRIAEMKEVQKQFRDSIDIESRDMLKFIFEGESSYQPRISGLGNEGGRRPRGVREALGELNHVSNANVEVFYDLPATVEAKALQRGNLAVAINGKVAVFEGTKEKPVVRWIPVEQYLYSVSGRGEFGVTHGRSYRNDVYGVRQQIDPKVVDTLVQSFRAQSGGSEANTRRLLEGLGLPSTGRPANLFDKLSGRSRIPRELPLPPKEATQPLVVHYAPVVENPEFRKTTEPVSGLGSLWRALRGRPPYRMTSTDSDVLVEMDPTSQTLVLDNFRHQKPVPQDFGLSEGTPIQGVEHALSELSRRAGGDVEILLSFTTGPKESSTYQLRRQPGFHPFGHIAIRVGDTVYNIEYQAEAGKDAVLVRKIPFKDYLYGTKPSGPRSDFGADYGVAYLRDTIGLRLSDVSDAQKEGILRFVDQLNAKWEKGEAKFDAFCSNCADLTRDSFLENAPQELKDFVEAKRSKIAVPLDVFDAIRAATTEKGSATLVRYHQLRDSRHPHTTAEFPLSPYQLLRSMGLIAFGGVDGVERQVEYSIGNEVSSNDLAVSDGPGRLRPRSRCPFRNLAGFAFGSP